MSKWVINRVGLLNFWYYQKQIFQLADGKMLLRGSNGSGKSLTMQSLFPVLFDGDTRAHRLDSFGSRDRKMEDYLLGEKGVSERNEGIGYLFLEVKKENREEYLTVGIGMYATRGGKLTKWFFAIENNQRVGIDFELHEEHRKDEITPLTKQKLKNRLMSVGRLFENRQEYKNYVNERIFGFETIEQFDELISLLINLRSPKLSKEFNPSAIYSILRDSLPKLKEDELLNLSKTIEQLDGHHERLSDLKVEVKNLSKFSQDYKKWHKELVGQIAGKWLNYLEEKREVETSISNTKKKHIALEEELTKQRDKKIKTEQEISILSKKIDSLNSHEGIDLARRGEELREELVETVNTLLKNQERHHRKSIDLREHQEQLERETQEWDHLKEYLEEFLIDNEQYVSYLNLDSLNKSYSQKMRTHIESSEFDYWKKEVKKWEEYVEEIIASLKELEKKRNYFRELDKKEGNLRQEIDLLDKDIRQWQQTRQNEIEKWKEAFSSWLERAPFQLSESIYFEILHRMDQLLEDDYREDYVLKPFREIYHQLIAEKEKEKLPLIQKVEDLTLIKQDNEEKIKNWENKKMPVIPKTEKREMNRQNMMEQTIFLPFYQSVDFLEEIPLPMRDNIEGALLSSGILDSLISNEGLTLSDDCQILPKPKFFVPTLMDYLQVSKEVPNELKGIIENILQSIVVDELDSEQPAIFSDGAYQIANLKGSMPSGYQASYIGAKSQERYRQEMIQQLKEANNKIDFQIKELEEKVMRIKQSVQEITTYCETYPQGNNVGQAILEKARVEFRKNMLEEDRQKLTEELRDLERQIKISESQLQTRTKQDQLKLSIEVYEEVSGYTKNYEKNLIDAYQVYIQIQSRQQTIKTLTQIVTRQLEEEQDYQQIIIDLSLKKEKQEALIAENQQQQQLLNVEEVQRSLTEAKINLVETEKEKNCVIELIHEIDKEVILLENYLTDTTQELSTKQYIEKNWHALFEKEATRFEPIDVTLETYGNNIKRPANLNKLQQVEKKMDDQYSYNISDNLTGYTPELLRLSIVELSREDENRLGELISYNQFKYPQFTIEEEKCGTFDLLVRLKEQQLTLEDLLKKDEEQLFKHFILESVGNILRIRIQKAMERVEKMNQLLKEQKNSQGLNLSIKWKPTTKSSDQDLGTARLVQLLQKPVEILSDEDKIAISQHFQEKVKFAQDQVKSDENDESVLFQAITKVLDYRDWFEFELKFKRANEGYDWQVLSDRRFNQFSGGEKAISMYLPLFIAVYSRYSDSESFCPKVITLDEAFAGIDDLNIAELFKACEQLGFNYVMNSQALFGDYPTVSSLMIYELLRPQNSSLVTAVNYLWNGQEKILQIEEI
ncbi:TIGR02680 family protein [Vagococcus carniphilus]|uniref:TIGR02680 family protein n=1 Tax=Vagococcus carniphilus TaxID=218144 RepID=UPI00288E5D83|nr:TIGR02680 family protein [Vagococcus carniphilus]MDT2830247.1 TIGR02680 family protein [Vagococcus carniphilus]MDT2838679.1 TIGR02680 family protein [Vagococcus carniphilus]MDT2853517.1 TIGR02680 family protein [Vagococcus carniphilus]